MKNYFGTDGIRNNHNFFIENNFALNLGKALGMLKYDNIYIVKGKGNEHGHRKKNRYR